MSSDAIKSFPYIISRDQDYFHGHESYADAQGPVLRGPCTCLMLSCCNLENLLFIYLLLKFLRKDFIYSFLERGREGEREGEKHQCVVASHTPPTGDLAHNPGMSPDWESSWRPFGSQAGTQSAEPQQPGHNLDVINTFYF